MLDPISSEHRHDGIVTIRKTGVSQTRKTGFLLLDFAFCLPFERCILLNSYLSMEDSIVAIASPPTPAPRGVVRLSGTQVANVLRGVGFEEVVAPSSSTGGPRRWSSSVELPNGIGRILVQLLYWPTKRSYTGQPSAEIHTVGSLPVLQGLVEVCCAAGARPARPGEFTMRAFLAGRLDLTQAEAVLGVIEAEVPEALQTALKQLAGNLAKPLSQIRAELIDLLADVEAGLDFVDEDIEFIADQTLIQRLDPIRSQIIETIDQMNHRHGDHGNTPVALLGEPNAGKSRLLNALCGSEVAIVSEIAGTTRDVVSTTIDLDGIGVLLQDTAGKESVSSHTEDASIGQQAQTMASQTVATAKVRLWCLDASLTDFGTVKNEMERAATEASRTGCMDLWVATKMDLVPENHPVFGMLSQDGPWIPCSSETREGLPNLQRRIREAIKKLTTDSTTGVMGTSARCRESLSQAALAIANAIEQTRCQAGHEFVSADLRDAIAAIGEVTGEVYNEDILDRVFSRFCIGK